MSRQKENKSQDREQSFGRQGKKVENPLRQLPADVLFRARSKLVSIGDALKPRAVLDQAPISPTKTRNKQNTFNYFLKHRKDKVRLKMSQSEPEMKDNNLLDQNPGQTPKLTSSLRKDNHENPYKTRPISIASPYNQQSSYDDKKFDPYYNGSYPGISFLQSHEDSLDEDFYLHPKLVLPVQSNGLHDTLELADRPRKKLSFRDPEIVGADRGLVAARRGKHMGVNSLTRPKRLYTEPCDRLSSSLENFQNDLETQAMRIVRTVGQAFEVCHKLSINGPPSPDPTASTSARADSTERAHSDDYAEEVPSESASVCAKVTAQVHAEQCTSPPPTFKLEPPPARKSETRKSISPRKSEQAIKTEPVTDPELVPIAETKSLATTKSEPEARPSAEGSLEDSTPDSQTSAPAAGEMMVGHGEYWNSLKTINDLKMRLGFELRCKNELNHKLEAALRQIERMQEIIQRNNLCVDMPASSVNICNLAMVPQEMTPEFSSDHCYHGLNYDMKNSHRDDRLFRYPPMTGSIDDIYHRESAASMMFERNLGRYKYLKNNERNYQSCSRQSPNRDDISDTRNLKTQCRNISRSNLNDITSTSHHSSAGYLTTASSRELTPFIMPSSQSDTVLSTNEDIIRLFMERRPSENRLNGEHPEQQLRNVEQNLHSSHSLRPVRRLPYGNSLHPRNGPVINRTTSERVPNRSEMMENLRSQWTRHTTK